jgi:hypothetical protein
MRIDLGRHHAKLSDPERWGATLMRTHLVAGPARHRLPTARPLVGTSTTAGHTSGLGGGDLDADRLCAGSQSLVPDGEDGVVDADGEHAGQVHGVGAA